MFKSYIHTQKVLFVLIGALVFTACSDESNSIFDPDWTGEPDPVISFVNPDSTAYAGIGVVTVDGLDPVTISGQNFGTNPDNIFVYFGTSKAEIIDLQDDRILVTPPDDPGSERRIRVTTLGTEKYDEYPSDTTHYELRSIYTPFPGFEAADSPRAITTGINGELYAMNILSDVNDGVITMDLEGNRTRVSALGESWFYSSIQYGPDGRIYSVRGGAIGVIYRFDPTDGGPPTPQNFVAMPRGFGGISAIAFDENDNLWASGTSGDILRVDINSGDVDQFPLDGEIRAINVFDGDLYASIVRDDQSGVWQVPIVGSDPAAEQLYVAMPSTDITVRDLVFTAGGDLVMSTNSIESLMVYRNNQLEELYPGVIPPGARTLAVSSNDPTQLLVSIIGTTIDGVSSETRILIVEMEQEMAPIYGSF